MPKAILVEKEKRKTESVDPSTPVSHLNSHYQSHAPSPLVISPSPSQPLLSGTLSHDPSIKTAQTDADFKSLLKTHLFT